MLPYLRVFGLALPSYPTLILAGLLTVWLLIVQRTRRLGWPTDGVVMILLCAFPAGAIGGRLLAWATEAVLSGGVGGGGYAGMTVLGSILGSLSFAAIAVPRWVRVGTLEFLDAVAFSMPMALVFGRLGCLALGCCHGSPAPVDAPAWLTVDLASHAPGTAPLVLFDGHAVASVWNLPLLFVIQEAAIAGVVELHYRRTRDWAPAGATAGLCLGLDACGRAWIEGFRGGMWSLDGGANPWAALTWVYVAVAVVGNLWIWARGWPVRRRDASAEARSPAT